MLGMLLTGITAVQLAGQPALMLDQARHMPTDALAGALLAPGHAPIVESRVHPFGMEAPMPWLVSVEFMTKPEANREAGLCEAQIVTVHFEPTEKWVPDQWKPLPARPTSVTERTIYRIPNGRLDEQSCQAPRKSFLEVPPGSADRQLEWLRMLAAARSEMLRTKNVERVTFDDRLGDEPVTDLKSVLARLPVDSVSWVNLRPRENELSATTKQALSVAGANAEAAILLAGDLWQVELVRAGDHLSHIHLIRRNPPPF